MQGKIGQFALNAIRMGRRVGGAVVNTGKTVLLATPRKMKLGIAERFGDFISGAREWEVLHKANTNRFTKKALAADWASYTKTLDGAKDVAFHVPRALVPQDRIHAFEGYLNAVANGEGIAEAREKNKGNQLYLLHAEFVALGGGIEVRENSRNNQAELVIKIPLCASKEEFRQRVAKAIKAAGIEDSCSVDEATDRLWEEKDAGFSKNSDAAHCDHDHGPKPVSPNGPVNYEEPYDSPKSVTSDDPVSRGEAYDSTRSGNEYGAISSEGPSKASSMPNLHIVEREVPAPPTRSQSVTDLKDSITAFKLRPVATHEKAAIVDAAARLSDMLKYRNLDVHGGLTEKDLENCKRVVAEMRSSGALDLSDSQRTDVARDLVTKLHAFKAGCQQKIKDLGRGSDCRGSSVDPLPQATTDQIRVHESAVKAAENLVCAIATLPSLASHCGVTPVKSPFQSSLAGALLSATSGMPICDIDEAQNLEHAPSHTPESTGHVVHGQGK
ncbi:hypothetical protein [Neorickettsia findlayensis]|uniref:Uncharacterized protein n=1 Tax=Neorickettsia findlayensis TaxID=2686014 RepID=A0A6P1G9G3_9RICK|nr:hypothetical protein [Neorickettsia findlayensis]QHD65099.1 hypothetical protein GP480_01340 [Neorickettsia findlayensis]